MEVVLGLAVAVSLGVSDVIGGLAGRRLGPLRTTTGIHVIGAVAIGIYLLATMQSLGGAREMLLSALAGLILAFSALCFYAGLSWGRVSVMSPVSFAAIAGLTFAVGLLRGERPSGLALAGAALIIPAVVLVARPAMTPRPFDRSDSQRRVGLAGELALSACAGGGFVVFQILLLEIGVEDGPAPLLIVRAVGGFLGLAALAAVRGRSPAAAAGRQRQRSLLAVVAAGTLLILSHSLLIEALNRGFLSVVGPITSLTPAFTVLGARLFLREHVSRLQASGMAVIIAGLVLLALG
ncbi:MAG: EamA family transporter [Acidimicrobiia bacterium]|nr:EamA family transporter [Acidimicrobiia bacterium]